ncbi:alpha-ketoglutarate-dependent dioxygenase AlkB family protein [Noviluteimonas dokdonensis]|nr:alpha-ketoglutarate-dependent dioxygenase AlkB [Lysobacter dokdonensis]
MAIHLPGADVMFDPDWLEAGPARALFDALRDGLPWERHRITVYGRTLDAPRLSCWIGDVAYKYSGTLFEPHPWPAALARVRERLEGELHGGFNSVLANLYRDGGDRLGFHRDSEPELGPEPLIASVSLGATRRFRFRARAGDGTLGLDLTHGSLLVMSGGTQRNWLHAVPPTARAVGPRINLTFRRVLPR